jgi:hypothetical protein
MGEDFHHHDEERRYRSPSIMSILAVISTVWILSIFTLVLFLKPVCGDGTTNLIIQAVYGILMLIMGFYFGTSYGSQLKTGLMAQMEPRPTLPTQKRTCCRPDPKPEGDSSGGGGAVG